jgi:hypothetical protein
MRTRDHSILSGAIAHVAESGAPEREPASRETNVRLDEVAPPFSGTG